MSNTSTVDLPDLDLIYKVAFIRQWRADGLKFAKPETYAALAESMGIGAVGDDWTIPTLIDSLDINPPAR